MAGVRFFRWAETAGNVGKPCELEELLTPFLAARASMGEIKTSEAVDFLIAQAQAGEIAITPGAELLLRMAIEGRVLAWLDRVRVEQEGKDRAEWTRRFVSDRGGMRYDRHGQGRGMGSRIVALESGRRQAYMASIERYLFTDGPAAARSQARLYFALNPGADPEPVACRAGQAVAEAVRQGAADVGEEAAG